MTFSSLLTFMFSLLMQCTLLQTRNDQLLAVGVADIASCFEMETCIKAQNCTNTDYSRLEDC